MKRPMAKISGNVPDDWNNYYRTCDRCGSIYHASEHGCSACEEQDIDYFSDDEEDRAAQEAAYEEKRDFNRENGGYQW